MNGFFRIPMSFNFDENAEAFKCLRYFCYDKKVNYNYPIFCYDFPFCSDDMYQELIHVIFHYKIEKYDCYLLNENGTWKKKDVISDLRKHKLKDI